MIERFIIHMIYDQIYGQVGTLRDGSQNGIKTRVDIIMYDCLMLHKANYVCSDWENAAANLKETVTVHRPQSSPLAPFIVMEKL